MTTVLRVPAMLVAAVLSFTPAVTAQDLSPEVQIDLAMAALERAILAEDHGDIVDRIGALRALAPELADGELLYFEAVALAGQGDVDAAERSLKRFLSKVGQQSARYEDALALMLDLPDLRLAKAKADRLAAAERRAEAQRQRTAAAAAERERLVAEEAQLNLSAAEIRHIRWTLYQDMKPIVGLPPAESKKLKKAELDMLAKYMTAQAIPFKGHLTKRIARYFRSKPYVPHSLADIHGETRQYATFGDWKAYSLQENGRCEARIGAYYATKNTVYAMPVLRLGISPDRNDAGLGVLMANPNPFRTDRPVSAHIDGKSFNLLSANTYVEGNDRSLTRAMRAGKVVVLRGVNRWTNNTTSISYSLIGFTAAFRHMAKACNRPDILTWIN